MSKKKIALLADENVSPRVVAYLRELGIDVLDVKEQGWQGSSDALLIERALLDGRIIFTHDSDFGKLVIGQEKPCYGIVYLRPKNVKPDNVIKIIKRLMSSKIKIEEGSIIVVEDSRVRVRKII